MWKFVPALLAISLMSAAPALAGNSAQEEANKKVVVELYEKGINQKDFEAAAKLLGPHYTQHNPRAADGAEGFKAFIGFLKAKLPNYHSEIKRVFADGDYVILHVHNVSDPGRPRRRDHGYLPTGKRQGGRTLGRPAGRAGKSGE